MQNLSLGKVRAAALLACAGAALTIPFLGGWNHSSLASPTSSLPTGSFRLTVKNLVTFDPSVVVTQVSIEKEGDAAIQVKGSSFDLGLSAASSQQDKGLTQAKTTLVADLTTSKNKANNTFKLLLENSSAIATSGYSSTLSTPNAIKVSDVLTITIQPGVYRLGTPLQLGTFQGKPITLTVR